MSDTTAEHFISGSCLMAMYRSTVSLDNSCSWVLIFHILSSTLNLAESRSFGAAGTFAFGTGTSDSVPPPYRSPNILKKTSYRYCNKLKKKKAQQSKLRASVTHSTHGIMQRCVHTRAVPIRTLYIQLFSAILSRY